MKQSKVMYGLYSNKHKCLLKFSVTSNPDDGECDPVAFSLNLNGDQVWLVDKQETAEKVSKASSEWFMASYNSPDNIYAGECKVVAVTVEYTA